MARVYVTRAQVLAAKLLAKRDRERGREPSPAVLAIANASRKPERDDA